MCQSGSGFSRESASTSSFPEELLVQGQHAGNLGKRAQLLCTSRPCCFNPFRTAAPFWGQSTQSPSSLSLERGCGPNRVNKTSPKTWSSLYEYYLIFQNLKILSYGTISNYIFSRDKPILAFFLMIADLPSLISIVEQGKRCPAVPWVLPSICFRGFLLSAKL